MIIGVPKEIKDSENRVGMTPGAVSSLTRRQHRVLVEMGAGLGSSITDEEYQMAGAEIVPYAADVWSADMVNKRLGLLGMRERVEMVGGSLTIESLSGRGTTVRALIPIHSPSRTQPNSTL